MDFIALTLEEAKEKALQLGIQFKPVYVDRQEILDIERSYRVVNQNKENGVINLFLMLKA